MKRTGILVAALRRASRGQALIEFAMLTPFIAFFLFTIIDFGIALDRKVVFTNAAREAARHASLGADTNETSIAQVAVDQSQGAFDTDDVNVFWVDKNGDGDVTAGEPVVVQIEFFWPLPIVEEIAGVFGAVVPNINLGACTDMALVQDVSGVPVSAPGAVPCGGT